MMLQREERQIFSSFQQTGGSIYLEREVPSILTNTETSMPAGPPDSSFVWFPSFEDLKVDTGICTHNLYVFWPMMMRIFADLQR